MKSFGPGSAGGDPEWSPVYAVTLCTDACVGRDSTGKKNTKLRSIAKAFKIGDGKAAAGGHGRIVSRTMIFYHASKAVGVPQLGIRTKVCKLGALRGRTQECLQSTKRSVASR